MFKKIKNPILFQGSLKKQDYFEGWYYKLVNNDQSVSLSFIPAVSLNKEDAHSFIQYILVEHQPNYQIQTTTGYCRYPVASFSVNNQPFSVTIGHSTFSENKIVLDLQDETLHFRGEIQFDHLTPIHQSILCPNIMGFFSYIPNMQCNHGVISMNHQLIGTISVNNRDIDFSGGKGYLEKDWGTSFPKHYIWLQSNHFQNETTSLFFSTAHIPLYKHAFEGFIGNLLVKGKEYRFATYNLSHCTVREVSANHCHIFLENKQAKLEIKAYIRSQGELIAPLKGEMNKVIKEGISGEISICLTDKETNKVYQDIGTNAGIEIVDYKLNVKES